MTPEQTLKLQYVGALGLLCEGAVHWGHGHEADELRESLEQALDDACAIIPTLRWKKVIHRYEMWSEAPRTGATRA